MRRALVIIIVLAVVVAASWFGYEQFGKAKAQAAPDDETVTIGRGHILSTVSATGSVLPEREANLNFQGAGTVAKVAVKAGDRIQAGQVLAELDTTDLELAIRQAEIGQRQTEGQLKQLMDGPAASDVAAAVAAIDSAKTAYEQVLKGSDKDQLAAACCRMWNRRAPRWNRRSRPTTRSRISPTPACSRSRSSFRWRRSTTTPPRPTTG